MKAYGEPQIVHFGSGNKAGYTLVQLIETSNICAHFTEEDDGMYLDVFSCKEFDYKDVEKVVKEYFEPKNIDGYVFHRQARAEMDHYRGQDKP
jgi:S-adenosylmethionine decarboxylase